MKTLLLLAVIVAFGLLQVQGNLLNFRNMIKLKTGRAPVPNYTFYGCYCGLGGKGAPKDATDRCCAAHDCCYKKLKERGCGTKLLSYKFELGVGWRRDEGIPARGHSNRGPGARMNYNSSALLKGNLRMKQVVGDDARLIGRA
uniref:Phospholipase A2 n=1 Tax=Catagonus wagneri TaxID=51154 RepID=A0A8C3W619_9CETA